MARFGLDLRAIPNSPTVSGRLPVYSIAHQHGSNPNFLDLQSQLGGTIETIPNSFQGERSVLVITR